MKLYKTTIIPESNFATTLKGDTLFGQICWSLKYTFGVERLKELLSSYKTSPFLVVSDGFVQGYLPKPKMPSALIGENTNDKKINRKKIWLTLDQLKNGEFLQAKTDEEVKNLNKEITTMHNSINYKTFKTSDDGSFAPYGEKEFLLGKKDVYFLLDETKLTLEELKKAFEQLSLNGYGKDATIGKGRFGFESFKELNMDICTDTFMALSPFSPIEIECKEIYYEPFTRFGKFGGARAFKNAFKNPIILADTASVIYFKERQNRQYIGSAIKDISKIYPDAVHQGFSMIIPTRKTYEI